MKTVWNRVRNWMPGLLVALCGLTFPGCSRESTGVSEPTADAPEVDVRLSDADWRVWRGNQGDNVSPDASAVVRWSSTEHVIWSADVPGRGHSTPVVQGDLVFVTTADEGRQQQLLIAYDRGTGAERWRSTVHEGRFCKLHAKNSHASASPVSDGNRVFTTFIHADALWVTAYERTGDRAWQTKVGDFGSEHGYGSSPALYEGSLIVNGDNITAGFLASIETATGDVAWKIDRPTPEIHGNYATPIVARLCGKPQLILSGRDMTASYDPSTGAAIWRVAGPAQVTACTPAIGGDRVFSSGGYPEKELLAIRADGEGDVEATHVAWRTKRGVTYVPSPLFHDGRLYVIADDGIASCFRADTGDVVWRERLDGNFSASPVLAGGHIYAPNEAGRMFVLRAGDAFGVVSVNELDGGGFASPVICGGRIYVRTSHRLFCIGQPAAR
ncbi:MAG: hypothetical protein FJ297_04050 [Planctomycetes bacterium]|nr:hypothetical protein [Planctomycetota bacterium]